MVEMEGERVASFALSRVKQFSHSAATHNSCSFITTTRKHQIQHSLFAHVYVLQCFAA